MSVIESLSSTLRQAHNEVVEQVPLFQFLQDGFLSVMSSLSSSSSGFGTENDDFVDDDSTSSSSSSGSRPHPFASSSIPKGAGARGASSTTSREKTSGGPPPGHHPTGPAIDLLNEMSGNNKGGDLNVDNSHLAGGLHGFISAIDWSEPFFIAVAVFHVALFIIAFGWARSSTNRIMCVMAFCFVVGLSLSWLNDLGSQYHAYLFIRREKYWQGTKKKEGTGAGQDDINDFLSNLQYAETDKVTNYFDPNGLFITAVIGAPLILLTVLLQIRLLWMTCGLMTESKRAQLKQQQQQQQKPTNGPKEKEGDDQPKQPDSDGGSGGILPSSGEDKERDGDEDKKKK